MSKLRLVLASLALTACASTASSIDMQLAGPHARIELGTAADVDGAEVVRRVVLDPTLPSVARIARRLRAELGDTLSAQVQLCVAPAGHVTRAAIERGPSSRVFEAAVLADVAAWRFAPVAGPPGVQTCQLETVVYRSPS